MQYSICVATDCDGEKVNLRFLFDTSPPSVAELLYRATVAFNNFLRLRHTHRNFVACAAVVFNDVCCTWDRLERSTQLLHNSQVYLFQPDILDLPAEIPEPFEGGPLLEEIEETERGLTNIMMKSIQPRSLFQYESPSNIPARLETRRGLSVGGRSNNIGIGNNNNNNKSRSSSNGKKGYSDTHRTHSQQQNIYSSNHYHRYDIKEENGEDRIRSTSVGTPRRGDGFGFVSSDRTPARYIGQNAFSISPSARKPIDESYRSCSDDRRSIIRDEREKIEFQWRLPLDEMRRSLREETLMLERSISPVRGRMTI